jgi:hypothetical protein
MASPAPTQCPHGAPSPRDTPGVHSLAPHHPQPPLEQGLHAQQTAVPGWAPISARCPLLLTPRSSRPTNACARYVGP